MRKTLRTRMLIYFVILSLIAIFLSSFSIFFGFEGTFAEYLRHNREDNVNLVKSEVIKEYQENGRMVNDELMGLLHQQAMNEQLLYKIFDKDGNLIVDTSNQGMHMMGMMGRRGAKALNQSFESKIKINDDQIGYDPGLLF